jgi:hypothetical protein
VHLSRKITKTEYIKYYLGLKVDEMGRTFSKLGEIRNVCHILGKQPEGKGPLGRPKSGWEDIIQSDLK